MYQVVEIKGDMEPWWFLEDWQEDIISTKEFENFLTMPSSTIKIFGLPWKKSCQVTSAVVVS
mgnify:CR=1 FL=1